MELFPLRKDSEYITLGQLLKAMNIAENGGAARAMIEEGIASVNGETEYRRGRKLYAGDSVRVEDLEIRVTD